MIPTFWAGKRALVTGATGLVGSWLVKALLERGAHVIALVRDWDPQSELIRSGAINRTSVVSGAVEDWATVERAVNEAEADTVFHLAAQTLVGTALRSPLPTLEANVRGTWNVLEAARVHPDLVKRVVVASSDKAYGDAEALPYTEEQPTFGRHPYDVSKSCADLVARMYHTTYGVPVTVARCGNIYGGGDLNWSRIVPGTIRSLWRNERPVLRSDGTFKRDYVYVLDAVEAYLLLAERLGRKGVAGECFNFGPSKPLTVLQVVAKLAALMGKRKLKPVIRNTATAEIHDQFLSSRKARRVLGWAPRYGFEEGLKATIVWYEKFLSETL